MDKIKIFNFRNGVVYPVNGKYHFRRNSNLSFVEDGENYILKKFCRVNTYRYPFMTYNMDRYILEFINDSVDNMQKYIPNT